MKKRITFILIIFLLLPITLAVETNLKKEYRPGETLITEISGNFIKPIQEKDIMFYSGRLYVPMIYDLTKIKDKYYLYAILPNKERNYTLIIKNAKYFEKGEEKQEDLKFNFSVKGEIANFNIRPGFIITNEDFSITLTNLNNLIEIQAVFLNQTKEVELYSGQEKKIFFNIGNKTSFEELKISSGNMSYIVPVMIFSNGTKIKKINTLKFLVSSLNLTVLKETKFEYEVELANLGQENISNVSLISELEGIKIEPSEIPLMFGGEVKKLNLTIFLEQEINKTTITASYENFSSNLTIYFNFFENKSEFKEVISNQSVNIYEEGTCESLGGRKCEEDYECEGTVKITEEGLCCLGECKKEGGGGGGGKFFLALIIIIIIALILFFVFKRFKKVKKSPKEVLKNRMEGYERKFVPKETPREVRGSLSKS